MSKYLKWQRLILPVTSLQLDDRNPRVPLPAGGKASQAALLEDLLAHEKVEDLAKEIVADGLSPLETLLGIQDGKRTLIVEGNRRLAALKLLISPELAPEKYIARFRRLAKQIDLSEIAEVPVLLAPSRTEAAPLLIQKHTRSSVEKWDLMMQARFYRSLIRDGLTLQSLLDRYGSEVSNFLRLAELHDVAKALELPDDVRDAVLDDRRFPASGLERLMEMPSVRKQLQIEFKDDGSFTVDGDSGLFVRAYTRIVTDLVTKVQDTRSLNTVQEAQAYVDLVLREVKTASSAPKPGKRKPTASSELAKADSPKTHDNPKTTSTAKSPPPPSKRRAATSKSLVPHGARCTIANPRISAIFVELKGLTLVKFPNSSGVMLRILLEQAVGHFLEASGKLDAILARGRKENKSKEWYPTLRQLLVELLALDGLKLSPLARKAVNKVMRPDSIISVDSMDQYVHNRYTHPTAAELRAFWEALEPVFAIVLHEPVPPAKK